MGITYVEGTVTGPTGKQTTTEFLVDSGGGWLMPQSELTADTLATFLITLKRDELLRRAVAARKLQKTQATEQMVAACEALAT